MKGKRVIYIYIDDLYLNDIHIHGFNETCFITYMNFDVRPSYFLYLHS